MIQVDVLTLFPKMIEEALNYGLLGQALEKKLLLVRTVNPRDKAKDRHRSVDDRPFGGGDGMIMLPEVLTQSIQSVRTPKSKVLYLSPQGKKLDMDKLRELAQVEHLVLLCGRYGGVDQRVINREVDEEISLGDYVLSGGEFGACVLIEALSRLLPGALGHHESADRDSFSLGLLECPQFTRPREYEGQKVPEILVGGDHRRIQEWKEKVGALVTRKKRPDLFEAWLQKQSNPVMCRLELEKFAQELSDEECHVLGIPRQRRARVAVGLLHHPVLDRKKQIIATNITNFDIHDIARAVRVYGVDRYYLIHPMVEQLMFVERVLDHWRVGEGARMNPMRKTAIVDLKTAQSFEIALKDWGVAPEKCQKIATSARDIPGVKRYTFRELRANIQDAAEPDKSYFLLFGTGFGLTQEFLGACDGLLEGISGASADQYRHLSVRSAVSICLDRLLGSW